MKAKSTVLMLSLVLGACSSGGSSATLEAITASLNPQTEEAQVDQAAYVEGYLEFIGPPSKWAGPKPLTLHLDARKPGEVQVSLQPDLIKLGTQGHERRLASDGMTPSYARQELALLATAMQGPEEDMRGCLHPLRVRLTRADGEVLERMGCRSGTGWPKVARELFVRLVAPAQPSTMKAQEAPLVAPPAKTADSSKS